MRATPFFFVQAVFRSFIPTSDHNVSRHNLHDSLHPFAIKVGLLSVVPITKVLKATMLFRYIYNGARIMLLQ